MKAFLFISKFIVDTKIWNNSSIRSKLLSPKIQSIPSCIVNFSTSGKQNVRFRFPTIKWPVTFGRARNKVVLDKIKIQPQDYFRNENFWRIFKLFFTLIATLMISLGSYLVVKLGSPEEDDQGHPVTDEFSNLPNWKQYILRSIRELEYYRRLVSQPAPVKLLPDKLGYPYSQPKYTLVIQLSDILIHSEWTYTTGWQFRIRPGLQFLLDSLHNQYEIVIYISEPSAGVLPVVEAIDPKHVIAYKLVKEDSIFSGGINIESLENLNRDLRKVVVIDWDTKVVKSHTENLLHVKRWHGEDGDTSLIDLALFLKTVAENNIDDVREVLEHYSKYDDPIVVFRNNQKKYIDHLETLAARTKSNEDKEDSSFWVLRLFRKKNV